MKFFSNNILREIKYIIRDKYLFVIFFVIPLLLTLMFSFIYNNEIVREIPIAIKDEDHSAISRKLISYIDASPSLKIKSDISDLKEIENSLRNQKVHAVFYIPKNFERNIKRGKNSTIVVYKSSQNILINNIIYEAALTTLKTFSAGIIIKKIQSSNQAGKANYYAMPINLETHLLFNSNYSYKYYLVPGFVLFTLQMVILLVSSSTADNTIKYTKNISQSFSEYFEKFFAYLLIHAVIFLILLLTLRITNIKYETNLFNAFIFIILFIITNVSIGIFSVLLISDQLFRTEALVFINTPAFIFSGFTFPIESMPFVHRLIGESMPFTHLLKLFIKIFQMNLPLNYCYKEIVISIVFTFSFMAFSATLIYKKIKLIS